MFRWFHRRSRPSGANATPPRQFLWMGGRRFKADSLYILPNDSGEWNRIDFQHYLLRTLVHSNYLAPLRDPLSILDAGCGPGRWAMEMAEAFPNANVVGIDLSVPSGEEGAGPATRPRPTNYTYIQASILERLPFNDASFDFAHQRLLYGSIPVETWPSVLAEYVHVTSPGGWIELVEGGMMVGPGPNVQLINAWLDTASQRRRINILLGAKVDTFLHNAGLRAITRRDINVPIGAYGGRIGSLMETNTMAFLENLRGLIVGQGIATSEEYDRAMRGCQQEFAQYQCTYPYYAAYGQRP